MSGKTSSSNADKAEETASEAEAPAAEKKSGGKKKLIILAAPVLLIAILAGLWFSGVGPRLLGMKHNEPDKQEAAKPAVPVFVRLTLKLVLSVEPGASKLKEPPLVVASPVAPPMLALSFSLKPSLAAVFVRLSNWLAKLSPTWMLPRFTGSGVCAPATARR